MTKQLPGRLIDSHQHFWSASEHFSDDYMPADYFNDSAPLHDILAATVFAECNTHYDFSLPNALQSTAETRFAAAISEAFQDNSVQLAAAIVGYADPMADDVPFEDVIAAHIEAGNGRLRALRRSVAWDQDDRFNYPVLKTQAHMLISDRFMRAASMLADKGIAFETWLYHPQLDELAQLAAAVPDCTIILDHAGTPLASGLYADWEVSWNDWKKGMADLATQPNVNIKIGGLITTGSRLDQYRQNVGLAEWTVPALSRALRPWLYHLLECFGPQRCIFESNFPVDRGHCKWSTLVEAYSEALDGFDKDVHEAIFSGNAARIYGIRV